MKPYKNKRVEEKLRELASTSKDITTFIKSILNDPKTMRIVPMDYTSCAARMPEFNKLQNKIDIISNGFVWVRGVYDKYENKSKSFYDVGSGVYDMNLIIEEVASHECIMNFYYRSKLAMK